MEPPALATAIVVAAHEGARLRLRKLCELLSDLGITVAVVESAEDAAAQMLIGAPDEPILVLIEASLEAVPNQGDLVAELTETIRGLSKTLPNAATVVAAPSPPTELIIEAFRAGASDFVDLSAETVESLAVVLSRLAERLAERLGERARLRKLRGMLEEFLRDLIKTERRSIDLEHQLQLKEKRAHERTGDLDSEREPVVVIVEDDREVADMLVDELEENGIATYAYITGEDAVEGVRKLVKKGDAVDLALVDAVLPGMSGLDAIAGMRQHRPHLAAFLMTGHNDTDIAQGAADLGVVGYVLKPFDDIAGLMARLKELALHFREQARDQHYLSRIKERHERVLTRYREVAAELDRFG